jgi:hypothetical protein
MFLYHYIHSEKLVKSGEMGTQHELFSVISFQNLLLYQILIVYIILSHLCFHILLLQICHSLPSSRDREFEGT